jgi:hypothetical protein
MSLRARPAPHLSYQVRLSDAADQVLFQKFLPCCPGRVVYESPQLHMELQTLDGNRSLGLRVNGQERVLRLACDQPPIQLGQLWLCILEIRDRA